MLTNLKLILLSIIILCIVLISFNCKNNIVNPPPQNNITLDTAKSYSHFLWPSKKGSYWVYNEYTIPRFENHDSNWTYENFNSFGFNLDTINSINTYKREIVDTAYFLFNDTLFPSHIIASYFNNQNTNFNKIYCIGKEGVFSLGAFNNDGDTLLKKSLYIPNEIKLNQTWNARPIFLGPSGFSAVEPIDIRLISVNDTVITKVGIFACSVVRIRLKEADDYPGYNDFFYYYAPNIGIVAEVRIFIVPNFYWFLDYIELLKSYYLNN